MAIGDTGREKTEYRGDFMGGDARLGNQRLEVVDPGRVWLVGAEFG